MFVYAKRDSIQKKEDPKLINKYRKICLCTLYVGQCKKRKTQSGQMNMIHNCAYEIKNG